MIKLVPWDGSALSKLLEESGLSAVRFSRILLARGDRTIRRWQKEGIPEEVETWAREDVIRLERRGHQLQLVLHAPTDPRRDRRSSTQERGEEEEDPVGG
jgi:hypothetical protein